MTGVGSKGSGRLGRNNALAVNSPGLSRLLTVTGVLTLLLVANSLYLAGADLGLFGAAHAAQGPAYQWMFLLHLALGLALIPCFLVYLYLHGRRGWRSDNVVARRRGLLFAGAVLLVILSGLLLTRALPWVELRAPDMRDSLYWLHVATPALAVILGIRHRLAGTGLAWPRLAGVALLAAVACVVLVPLLGADSAGSPASDRVSGQFFPSLAKTADGAAIPAEELMMDAYCADCHADIHAGWALSAHRFSSLNNPVYRFAFDNTRAVLEERDGHAEALRFCAGCHDPVLMFSGALLDEEHDEAAASAGITCLACHAISAIDSPRGNADYRISRPQHYPFARSTNPALRWVNHQLIRANPALHKRSFLKPLHRSPEFCASCHKVHIPEALNDYRWLRGQNHYDSFLLSGVSGGGVASYYYPERAVEGCSDCHLPGRASEDLAAKADPANGEYRIHDHMMVGGHSALAVQMRLPENRQQRVREMLEGAVRLDIFALREGGRPDGRLLGPLGIAPVSVRPGEDYLLELVVRTLTPGHVFTEGTADSNEIWLELELLDGDQVIARSGARDPRTGAVHPLAHFVNSYVVDREGRRITGRNVEAIHTAVYNHQIAPGAADTVHYRLSIPPQPRGPLQLRARLQYRKFSGELAALHAGASTGRNELPIVTVAEAVASLPLAGSGPRPDAEPVTPAVPEWERWNDYGIGLLASSGLGQLRQAAAAFARVESLGAAAGTLNLARTYLREGQLERAAEALARADSDPRAAPPWTRAWLYSEYALATGRLDDAVVTLRQLLATEFPDARARGFDFSTDYRVWARLGEAYRLRARRERGEAGRAAREAFLGEARDAFLRVLELDPEHGEAHYGLSRVYRELGQSSAATRHADLHEHYRPDDSARATAVAAARERDEAARLATNDIVIYPLISCRSRDCDEI